MFLAKAEHELDVSVPSWREFKPWPNSWAATPETLEPSTSVKEICVKKL
jgi:hypothetical protein